MKKPAFVFEFVKGQEDWFFGLITMDLMFFFFLIPEKSKNYEAGVMLWFEYDLQRLALNFSGDRVSMNAMQSNLFLDGTDAISRMLLTGDDQTKDKIYNMVKLKSNDYESLEDFEQYYLQHSTKLLNHIQDFCSKDDAFFEFYKSLFQRGRDYFNYEEWRKGLNSLFIG